MSYQHDPEATLFVRLMIIAGIICLFAITIPPYFEARTFNKFTTGPKATYWDALWINLRVIPQGDRR